MLTCMSMNSEDQTQHVVHSGTILTIISSLFLHFSDRDYLLKIQQQTIYTHTLRLTTHIKISIFYTNTENQHIFKDMSPRAGFQWNTHLCKNKKVLNKWVTSLTENQRPTHH